ncbi:hypothetical protein P124_02736, partial [Staphylococcus aureus M1073]
KNKLGIYRVRDLDSNKESEKYLIKTSQSHQTTITISRIDPLIKVSLVDKPF